MWNVDLILVCLEEMACGVTFHQFSEFRERSPFDHQCLFSRSLLLLFHDVQMSESFRLDSVPRDLEFVVWLSGFHWFHEEIDVGFYRVVVMDRDVGFGLVGMFEGELLQL